LSKNNYDTRERPRLITIVTNKAKPHVRKAFIVNFKTFENFHN